MIGSSQKHKKINYADKLELDKYDYNKKYGNVDDDVKDFKEPLITNSIA